MEVLAGHVNLERTKTLMGRTSVCSVLSGPVLYMRALLVRNVNAIQDTPFLLEVPCVRLALPVVIKHR
jgi:hypothetical protein